MARNKIITGLDVGTNSIKALTIEKMGDEWNVLSYAQIPSFGMRRGVVVNVDEVAKNIQVLMANVERDVGKKINSVYVNISGSHLYTLPSDGLISVSRADHIISQEDIERVLQATRAINIPMNEEILDVFPREFVIDDQKGIKQPLNLTGVRLQAKVVLLCYFQQHFINLTQAVLGARLQIDDVIPSPLAAAEAVLNRQQKEIGAAVIDIGSATTSLIVYEEGEVMHVAVFPIGSGNITNDLAIGLRTEVAIAEEIKRQYGTCMLNTLKEKNGLSGKKVDIAQTVREVSFTKKDLVRIIEPRVSEIIDLMQKELKKIGRQELLPGGIVLTGGGAKLPKIKELAKEKLRLPCEIGVPRGILGLQEDPTLATVVGLVRNNPDFMQEGDDSLFHFSTDFMKDWGGKMRRMFRVFIP